MLWDLGKMFLGAGVAVIGTSLAEGHGVVPVSVQQSPTQHGALFAGAGLATFLIGHRYAPNVIKGAAGALFGFSGTLFYQAAVQASCKSKQAQPQQQGTMGAIEMGAIQRELGAVPYDLERLGELGAIEQSNFRNQFA